MSLFQIAADENYDILVAENAFITDVQMAIEAALKEANVTQAELARQMGVSEARVSQILGGNGKNLQARTIARVAHALGLKPVVDLVQEASGWISSEVEIEEGEDEPCLLPHWMSAFLASGPAGAPNDNGWTTPTVACAPDRLVAA